MKRYTQILAFLLLSLAAQIQPIQAQTVQRWGWQPVIKYVSNTPGWVRRDSIAYPNTTSGIHSFTTAVTGKQFVISLTDPATAPSNAKARLSLNNNLLYLEGAGDIKEVKFERQDGTYMTGTNPDSVRLQSGVFYGYGSNSSPPFDKQWKAIFRPGVAGKVIKLTFKQSSGSSFAFSLQMPVVSANSVALFGTTGGSTTTPPPSTTVTTPTTLAFNIVSYDCQSGALQYKFTSPNSGAVSVSMPGIFAGYLNVNDVQNYTFPGDARTGRTIQVSGTQGSQSVNTSFTTSCTLTSPGSTTTTNPPSTTGTIAYSKVLVLGNSITWNNDNGRNWGMAASAANKDFYTLVGNHFRTYNPSVTMRKMGDGFGLAYGNVEGLFWEQYYWRLDDTSIDIARGGLSRYQPVTDWMADCIIVELGDNITDNTHNLAYYYTQYINKLKEKKPNIPVLVCSPIITYGTTNQILQNVAAANGWIWVDLSNIQGAVDPTQYNHPNDQGMATIANRIIAKIPTATTVTPPPSTTSGAGFLAYSHQGVGNVMTLESNTVKIDFYLNLGGIPQGVYLKGSGGNLISTPFLGDSLDGGQSINFGIYESPYNTYTIRAHVGEDGNNVPAQVVTGQQSTGFNPIPGGSIDLSRSRVYKWAKVQTTDRGTVLCIQVRPRLWNPRNVYGNALQNYEYWLFNERTLSWKVQTIIEDRNPSMFDPNERTFLPFRQEFPTVYGASDMTRHIYRLNGNDVETQGSGENLKDYHPDNFAFTHCDNSLTRCLTLYTPRVNLFKSDYIGPPFMISKFESNPSLNFDNSQAHLTTGSLIIGSRAQAMAIIPTLDQPTQDFDFDFTGDLHDWFNGRGTMKRVNGKLELNIGAAHTDNGHTSYDASVRSPSRRWVASQLTTIKLRAAFTHNQSQAQLIWQRRNGDGSFSAFSKYFPVIGDGVERDYLIDTSHPQWIDIIDEVGIQAAAPIDPDAKLILTRIYKLDSGLWLAILVVGGLLRRRVVGIRQQKPKNRTQIIRIKPMKTLIALSLLLVSLGTFAQVSELPPRHAYRGDSYSFSIPLPLTVDTSAVVTAVLRADRSKSPLPGTAQPTISRSTGTATIRWDSTNQLPPLSWLEIKANGKTRFAGELACDRSPDQPDTGLVVVIDDWNLLRLWDMIMAYNY